MTETSSINKDRPTRKIKKQFLYIYLLVLFLPLFLVGVYSIHIANAQMLANYEGQVTSDNKRIKSVLFDITTVIYNFSENITNSNRYTALFSSDDYAANQSAYDSITDFVENYCSNTTSISSACIYTLNPNIPNNSVIKPISDYSDMLWYSDSLKTQWDMWTNVIQTDSFGNETPTLTLIRRLAVTNQAYPAYLVISVSTNYIKSRLSNTDYSIFCSVNNSMPFICPSRYWIHKGMPFPDSLDEHKAYYSFTGSILLEKKKALTNLSTFLPYKTNDHFYIIVSDLDAYGDINRILLTYILILIAAVVFPSIIIYRFSSHFDKRLTTLKNVMHQVRLGDYNIIQNFRGDDELKAIFLDLQSTVKYIYETEKQFYQSRIKEQQLINNQQKMEFQLLASQINPHFLYNTLETIRMQALASGNRDVANSVQLLGNSMHYVLENTGTDSITLEMELEYIHVYLSIQKLRFGKRIDFDILVDPDVNPKKHKILPFLLQPVIENAITHGLESRAYGGYIWVYIHLTGTKQLTVEVQDNGCGMTPEQLLKINAYMNADSTEEKSGSIGLFNINQRIYLLYGSPYGIRLESTPAAGTLVTLTLPINFIYDGTGGN